ncbi:hypothetical protein CR51_07635 [Caballeronia megalochromosomata]|nr:hypothetical protein CR51_07635 [Caballeronia megalochromosomata]
MYRILLVLLALFASTTFADEREQRRHHANDELRLPVVYDAQGKAVGSLEVYSGVNGVFLNIGGRAVFVAIDHKRVGALQYTTSAYEWVGAGFVPYMSHDCSGSMAVADAGSPAPAMPVREGADVTVYIAGTEPSGGVQVWSYKTVNALTGVATCTSVPFDAGGNSWPIKSTYPLTQHFPEPLRVSH